MRFVHCTIYAVSNGLYKYADIFINQGANVNTRFSTHNIPNQTPLIVAAHYGRSKCLKLLLKSGSYVNQADGNGLTALMAAVAGNQSEHQTVTKSRRRCE